LIAVSAFGDYEVAVNHLRRNEIVTKNPEKIYRGIFRYVLEKAKGRKCVNEKKKKGMEMIFIKQFQNEFFNNQSNKKRR